MDFYRVEHHTIMSGLVVRYYAFSSLNFEISASRDGVLIQGSSPSINAADAGDINLLIVRAVEIAQTLASPRLHNSDHRPTWMEFKRDPPCVIELHKAHFGDNDEIVEKRPRYGKSTHPPSTEFQGVEGS